MEITSTLSLVFWKVEDLSHNSFTIENSRLLFFLSRVATVFNETGNELPRGKPRGIKGEITT